MANTPSSWRRSAPADKGDTGRAPTATTSNSNLLDWSGAGLSTFVALLFVETFTSTLPLLTWPEFTFYTRVLEKSVTCRKVFRIQYGPFKDQGA